MNDRIIKVGIIGGGAAGLFMACQLKRLSGGRNIDVTILEKSSIPGRKLTLTGHGRCNITNRKDTAELRKGYHEADNFIYPALKEFGPEDTISFFENELGLKTKEEDNNRIFPVCDSAVTVRDTILTYISDSTTAVSDAKVLDISRTDSFEVTTAGDKYSFDYLVLSCGGNSFQKTGSAGDSYRFAEKLGHTLVPIRPALVPVNAGHDSAKTTSALSGVSVSARVTLYCSGKAAASQTGEILFADFGLTGPAVMEISREIPCDITGMDACLELDLIPDMNDEQFDQEFQKLIREHADTKITTLLSRFMPQSVAGEIAATADVSGLYAQGFTKENRKNLIKHAKHLKITLAGVPVMDRAYVTRGGVSLKEMDRKTMQSKKVPGLYILGEALDIDGISGGYNLQACMSEAYLAAKSILGL